MCLAASTGSVASVATSITTSEQTFQIAGSPVTVAGQVLAAKLPLPANSKIVTLNMPTTQGGREHECHPFPLVCAYTFQNGWKRVKGKNTPWEEVLTQRINAASVSFVLFSFLYFVNGCDSISSLV